MIARAFVVPPGIELVESEKLSAWILNVHNIKTKSPRE
jgi:hypothetical protein